ncbi:hypothetical protein DET50_10732 [Marinobacter pelagius]|uniref:Uncharacterized protein n=1 Tax=Marinobacter pelagius TaxID=379482 RepID=A0A366GU05_9GAMM|nr:hypothetical protein DET50_10732 [Marinobacter pelagius]
MINTIRRWTQRRRLSLVIWGLNITLVLILLVFVLR